MAAAAFGPTGLLLQSLRDDPQTLELCWQLGLLQVHGQFVQLANSLAVDVIAANCFCS
jgi:hypothetical protein